MSLWRASYSEGFESENKTRHMITDNQVVGEWSTQNEAIRAVRAATPGWEDSPDGRMQVEEVSGTPEFQAAGVRSIWRQVTVQQC